MIYKELFLFGMRWSHMQMQEQYDLSQVQVYC